VELAVRLGRVGVVGPAFEADLSNQLGDGERLFLGLERSISGKHGFLGEIQDVIDLVAGDGDGHRRIV